MSLKKKLAPEELDELKPTPGVELPIEGKQEPLDTGKDFAANKQLIKQALKAVLKPHAGHLNNLGCAYAWLGDIPNAAIAFEAAAKPQYGDFGNPPDTAKAQAKKNRKLLDPPPPPPIHEIPLPDLSMERKDGLDLPDVQ